MDVSIVVPIHNEEDNLRKLVAEIHKAMQDSSRSYEALLVDDGSRDRSAAIIREMIAQDNHLRLVELRRNYGQTAAMQASRSSTCGIWDEAPNTVQRTSGISSRNGVTQAWVASSKRPEIR